LRHFSDSGLIAAGRDARTLACRLGHAAASTALRVYAHMVEGQDREAADFLGQLITADRPAPLDG
jgi:integrase